MTHIQLIDGTWYNHVSDVKFDRLPENKGAQMSFMPRGYLANRITLDFDFVVNKKEVLESNWTYTFWEN